MGGGPGPRHSSGLNPPSLGLSVLPPCRFEEQDYQIGEQGENFAGGAPPPAAGRIPGPLPSQPQSKHSAFVSGTLGKGRGGEERGPRAAPSASLARKAAQQVWSRLPEARGSSAARGQLSLRCLPGCAGSSPTNALRVPGQASALPGPMGRPVRSRSVKVLQTGTERTPRPAPPRATARVNHRPGRARRERGACGPCGDFLLPRAGVPTPAPFMTYS